MSARVQPPHISSLADPDAEPLEICLGREPLSIESLVAIARGRAQVALDEDPALRSRIVASRAAVVARLEAGEPFYGVNTGVGASVRNRIPGELQDALPLNLVRFHGAGTGAPLSDEQSAAMVASRLASISRGYSGVRLLLLERLCETLNLRVLPIVPSEGSVGASGDLTPLSYLAATLVGEREVTLRGHPMSASAALAELSMAPIELEPKESLALMNGTSMMVGLGCLAHMSAQRLARLSAAITAVVSDVVHGNAGHFDARIAALRPHPGQVQSAAWIREDLTRDEVQEPQRVQDRYSIRCAPQIIGVLLDALSFSRDWIETELNGVNDNPIVDPDTGDALHGGNFYGGHICFAMDGLKVALANIADLLDRQLVLLCCPETSGGLPENLVARADDERVVHHGFKAMQITASALAAEALKISAPASVFSRSTESHNQDKVSMGSIAARECLRIVELVEQVSAISVLAVCQAVDLRGDEPRASRSAALHAALRKTIPMLAEDRRQDLDIQEVLERIRRDELPIGSLE
jgi:histidine ammonia-lyase